MNPMIWAMWGQDSHSATLGKKEGRKTASAQGGEKKGSIVTTKKNVLFASIGGAACVTQSGFLAKPQVSSTGGVGGTCHGEVCPVVRFILALESWIGSSQTCGWIETLGKLQCLGKLPPTKEWTESGTGGWSVASTSWWTGRAAPV